MSKIRDGTDGLLLAEPLAYPMVSENTIPMKVFTQHPLSVIDEPCYLSPPTLSLFTENSARVSANSPKVFFRLVKSSVIYARLFLIK